MPDMPASPAGAEAQLAALKRLDALLLGFGVFLLQAHGDSANLSFAGVPLGLLECGVDLL